LVLGQLVVFIDGEPVTVGGPQVRALLACLLANANQVISVEKLIEMLWPLSPPKRPRDTLLVHMGRLRQVLEPGRRSRSGSDRLRTESGGYRLRVDPGELDAEEFQDLARLGQRALAAGDAAHARQLLADGLDLWRGPVLADTLVDALERDWVPALEQIRLLALEDRIEADLRLGAHPHLLGELRDLVASHPTRERLLGEYLVALYRSGLKAEALKRYEEYRQSLSDEQGADPGPQLQRVWLDILADHDRVRPADRAGAILGPPHPQSQLPADIPDFTGREDQLTALYATLATPKQREGAIPVVGISGPHGVGKTALAVHLAHRLRKEYPDGQLFAHLHGAAERHAQPTAVLANLLRALGLDGAILPSECEERAALFRSALSDRRVLLVLDDAADAAQVRPLLPGSPHCGVILTSRRRLAGLPGLQDASLPVLNAAEAITLLRQASNGRTEEDPATEAEIATLCDRLPLALRIAGSRLASRPHWPVSRLRDNLHDDRRRLDELTAGDLAVRASIATSDRALSDDATALLRLLAVTPAGDIPAWFAAAVLDRPLVSVEAAVEELIDSRLLDPVQPGRTWAGEHLRFQDLTRLYARQEAESAYPADHRRACVTRVLQAWVSLTRDAVRAAPSCALGLVQPLADSGWVLPAQDRSALIGTRDEDALRWLDAERGCLLAAVEHAAATGLALVATELSLLLGTYYSIRGLYDDWQTAANAAHAAATAANCRTALAHTTRTLGEIRLEQGHGDHATHLLNTAAHLAQEIGDRHAHGLSLFGLGMALRATGNLTDATTAFGDAKTELNQEGDAPVAAHARAELAWIRHRTQGDPQAVTELHEALRIFTAHNLPRSAALILRRLGMISLQDGNHEEAITQFHHAKRLCTALDDRRGNAECTYRLGLAALEHGEHDEARTHLNQAAELLRGIGDTRAEAYTELALGLLHQRTGHPARAQQLLNQALQRFIAAHDAQGEAQARQALAEQATNDDQVAN
jgi:DNA-binding SARP family transcriptional activator